MKKFLLSIFAVMLAVFSVQAEETVTFNFKNLYGSSTVQSIGSKTVDGITVSYDKNSASSAPGFNKDGTMRLYYAAGGDGCSATFTTDGKKKITKVVITAATTPTVKYYIDGGAAATGTWNSKTMTISNIQATQTFKIQNANTSNVQLQISSIVFTCENVESGETPEPEPEPEPEPGTPENIEGGTVSFIASDKGYANQTNLSGAEIELNDYITATFNKATGSTNPQYYTSGTSVRCYGGNTFTIASTAGNITEIVLTFGASDGTNEITANVGSYSNATWTGAAQSVTFTVGGSKGNRRIASIKVTYAGKSAGEPEIINVEQPVISSDKAEYAVGEEAVVTITTATEGATIYYSLNDDEPTTVYTEPIVLYETTTVKAVAKMEGANDSPLAEKTIEFKKVVTLVNATVAEVIAAFNSGDVISDDATVVGYIVGVVDGTSLSNAVFGNEDIETLSNILLADDPNEMNIEKCLPVQLPTGDIRTALNLVDNSDNYLKKVVLTGDVVAYFTVAGLKNTSAYEFVEEEEPATETWSSFYAPIPVAIPEGVEAYIVTAANAGYVTLTQIYNGVPANTGVILKGGSIEATYYSGEVAEVTGNLLQGTMANTYISEEAYVLGCVDGEYGFYKADMNQQDGTAWLANAGKAYLPVSALPASAQGTASFSFRFGEGTTGVENVEVENEVKAIYDLTGRRVEAITAPGIYIVNGVKRVVR